MVIPETQRLASTDDRFEKLPLENSRDDKVGVGCCLEVDIFTNHMHPCTSVFSQGCIRLI